MTYRSPLCRNHKIVSGLLLTGIREPKTEVKNERDFNLLGQNSRVKFVKDIFRRRSRDRVQFRRSRFKALKEGKGVVPREKRSNENKLDTHKSRRDVDTPEPVLCHHTYFPPSLLTSFPPCLPPRNPFGKFKGLEDKGSVILPSPLLKPVY